MGNKYEITGTQLGMLWSFAEQNNVVDTKILIDKILKGQIIKPVPKKTEKPKCSRCGIYKTLHNLVRSHEFEN